MMKLKSYGEKKEDVYQWLINNSYIVSLLKLLLLLCVIFKLFI